MTSGYIMPSQAAALCAVSAATIPRWAAQGLVPGVVRTLSGRYRIPQEVLGALLRDLDVASQRAEAVA